MTIVCLGGLLPLLFCAHPSQEMATPYLEPYYIIDAEKTVHDLPTLTDQNQLTPSDISSNLYSKEKSHPNIAQNPLASNNFLAQKQFIIENKSTNNFP